MKPRAGILKHVKTDRMRSGNVLGTVKSFHMSRDGGLMQNYGSKFVHICLKIVEQKNKYIIPDKSIQKPADIARSSQAFTCGSSSTIQTH